MSFGYNPCYASCPPSTVTIQPPPFTLCIPGPSLYCPDQPLGIQQYNPCEQRMIPYGEGGAHGRYGSFFGGATSGFGSASIYSQKSLSQRSSGCGPCQL